MRFSSIVAPVALAAVASAAPTLKARGYDGGDQCIPYDVAVGIQSGYVLTLTNFNLAAAQTLLYPTMTDISASIQILAGGDLNAPVFTSAEAYEAGQGSLPPIGFTILTTFSITCDGTIAFRWVANVGSNELPVHGMTVLQSTKVGNDAVVGPTGWQLSGITTEFSTAPWIKDTGGSFTLPPPPTSS